MNARHFGLTRRAVVAGTTAAGGGLVLSACGAGDSSAPPKKTEPVKLVFGRRASAAEQPVLEQYVASYRQIAPNVTVEMTVLPSGLQEMRQGLITAFARGSILRRTSFNTSKPTPPSLPTKARSPIPAFSRAIHA